MSRLLTPRVHLLLLLAAAAPAFAQPVSPSLENVGAETEAAAEAESLENAKALSARPMDGEAAAASETGPAPSSGASPEQPSGSVAASAVRRGSISAKVSRLPHVPPASESRRPGAIRILLEAPLSLVTVPAGTAVAAYYAASSSNYVPHRSLARVLGALGAVLGAVAGLILVPVVMVFCLGKVVSALRHGRF